MLDKIRGGLVVSCQALENEPLHGSAIMARMALAAKDGGAVAIRAQGADDIRAVGEATGLPVIGLIKRNYPDSDIYITPTQKEMEEISGTGCAMAALDMTLRTRPGGEKAEDLVKMAHAAGCLVLADISTKEEALMAVKSGADAVSTTLSGYTPYSPHLEGPDFDLVADLARHLSVPVFAEGRVSRPEEAARMLSLGAWCVVVGSAITRPQLITAGFARALKAR